VLPGVVIEVFGAGETIWQAGDPVDDLFAGPDAVEAARVAA
jgi:hypothetical protein